MKLVFSSILFLIAVLALAGSAAAQAGIGRNKQEQLPKSLREKLIKMKIEEEKKEFDKLIERSETVSRLSTEIQSSFEKNKTLTQKDEKKLLEVEKLLKKIRRELNAKRDKESKDKNPASLLVAIDNLQKNTVLLFKELKKNTRHSISVAAIQSSNVVWKLVKFIRLRKR